MTAGSIEISKEISPFIFRAYDIRGVYPEQLNEGVMKIIGAAAGY